MALRQTALDMCTPPTLASGNLLGTQCPHLLPLPINPRLTLRAKSSSFAPQMPPEPANGHLLGHKEPRSRSALAEQLTAPNQAEETHSLSLI